MNLADDQRIIPAGRALFYAVGLRKIYEPGELRITKADLTKAAKLEPQLHKIVREFIDGSRETVPLPTEDYEDTEEILFKKLTAKDIEDNLVQFRGHPSWDDFATIATHAREYLQAKLPRRVRSTEDPRQTLTWRVPQAVPLSRGERLAFRKHLATVQDPTWAVRNLLAATLGREHIEGLTAVWPDVLQTVQAAAETKIADEVTKNPKFTLSRRVARQLGVLLDRPSVPNTFVQALQAEFAREAEQIAAAKAREAAMKPTDHSKLQTSVQRVAER
jgi:hypothetical protein